MAEVHITLVCELKNVRAIVNILCCTSYLIREANAAVLPSNGCMLHQSRNPLIMCNRQISVHD